MAVALSLPAGVRSDGMGLDESGAGSSWVPLSEGSRWLATASWMLLGTYLPTALFGTLGTAGALLLAAYAACHLYAVTQWRTGLMPLVAERPQVGHRVAVAWWSAIALFLVAAAVSLVGAFVALPLPFRFLAFAAMTPFLASALISLRFVGIALADACGLLDELPQPNTAMVLLLCLAPLHAIAWVFAAISFGLAAPASSLLFGIGAWSAIALGAGLIWVLLRQIDLFVRVGLAVSASEQFSSAARRVARMAKGPLRLPASAASEELPPIEIADAPRKASPPTP